MLRLTLRQLEVFEAVAHHLSYSRASETLHLTQPAVSIQIKQLEEAVGVPLFEQLGKKIYLTEAGQELRRYARNIMQQLEEADHVFGEMKGMRRGKLAISVASTAGYFMPILLAEFSKRFPEVAISLNVTNREALLQQFAQNEMDFAIMGRPPDGLGLEFTSFLKNPLVVIAPPDHALAQEHRIPLERLQQEPFISREQGSGTRSASERFFAAHGLKLKPGTEMSKNESIKQAVQAGMGLSILSLNTVMLELEAGRLVVLDVEEFPIMRHWYLVHRSGKRLTGVALAFQRFILDEAAALLESVAGYVQPESAPD
jgi:DNA-binding transcriptional LysR family regulator